MGGNVFSETSRIKRENVQPTLDLFFEQLYTVFPKARRHIGGLELIGSAGKKEFSGDIDLALSEYTFTDLADWDLDHDIINKLFTVFKKRARTATDEQLRKKSIIVALADKLNDSNTDLVANAKGSSAGTLFLVAPQFGAYHNCWLPENVQVDISIGNIDWLKFAYHSDSYEGNVKGLHRTQLIIALFSNKGYTFSHNYGVKNKITQRIVADTPKKAVEFLTALYGLEFRLSTLRNYHDIMMLIKTYMDQFNLEGVLDLYLKVLDSTRVDIPDDCQMYWKLKQEALNLTGKFLPEDSKLTPYKV